MITYSSKYLILFALFILVPADITSDLYRNQLHFGYGINYKYNGQLYHNLDRVWVVHRVVILKAADLQKLPEFPSNLNCHPSIRNKAPGHEHNLRRKTFNTKLCLLTRPHLQYFPYFQNPVSRLIREDLYHALHSLHPVSHFEYRRLKKRALPQPHGMVLDTDPLTNKLLHLQTFHYMTFQETGLEGLLLGQFSQQFCQQWANWQLWQLRSLASIYKRKEIMH